MFGGLINWLRRKFAELRVAQFENSRCLSLVDANVFGLSSEYLKIATGVRIEFSVSWPRLSGSRGEDFRFTLLDASRTARRRDRQPTRLKLRDRMSGAGIT